MPLKCRACGQCHTARRGCADVYATLERMAGSMPEPKDTPGEWVLECGKHHQPYRACCEGRYTLKWRWKDADPTPPPVETDAGQDEVLINEARVSLHRRIYGTTNGAERAEEHVSGLLARLATAEAEHGRLRAEREHLLSLVRSSLKPHGLCQPRERRACTACNAIDELREIVKAWGGLRVHPAALETPPHD